VPGSTGTWFSGRWPSSCTSGRGGDRQLPGQLPRAAGHRRAFGRKSRPVPVVLLGRRHGRAVRRRGGHALHRARKGPGVQRHRRRAPGADLHAVVRPRGDVEHPGGRALHSIMFPTIFTLRCTGWASTPARVRASSAWRSSAARSCRSSRAPSRTRSGSRPLSSCRSSATVHRVLWREGPCPLLREAGGRPESC